MQEKNSASEEKISARLRSALASTGMSQAKLARASGLTQAYISELISGRKQSLTEVSGAKIAKALSISLSWLLFGKGEMNEDNSADRETTPSFESGFATSPSVIRGGLAEMGPPALISALSIAAKRLETSEDPTIRAALACHIEKLARELAGRELHRISAGIPDS